MKDTILIFDIGKTNKKALLFDSSYQVLESEVIQFEMLKDEDGDPVDDIEALVSWVLDTYQIYLKRKDIRILGVNFSAYGATMVHLDENRKVIPPVYDYLKPISPDLVDEFYQRYGGKEEFCRRTASPPLGMLNAGLQLYWLKKSKPEKFSAIKVSLHLPQFLAFLIHGEEVNEITSMGCHTALWDFDRMSFHSWVKEQRVDKVLPPLVETNRLIQVDGISIGVGIHDSSASLARYIRSTAEPFILVSTGTWSISLNPFNHEPLKPEEMEMDCLHYLSHQGKPVKAARLFLGNEHDYQVGKICERYHTDPQYLYGLDLNPDLVARYINSLPNATTIAYNADPMLDVDISRFDTAEEAYCALVVELASLQRDNLNRVQGNTAIKNAYITGGFCQNEIFLYALRCLMPGMDFYLSDDPQASALGAGMIMDIFKDQQPHFHKVSTDERR